MKNNIFKLILFLCTNCMAELSQAEEAVFDGIDFVKITTSPFRFGSSSDSPYATHFENQMLIDIDHEFWISKYEITQAQWIDVVGSNPSIIRILGNLGQIPVNSISWYEAKEFINLLNQRTDNYYRLPTEVEWEYVARANSTTEWSFGDDPSNISAYVWMNDSKPRNIGLTLPNSFGVYDMYGNASEWVEDSYELVKDPDQGACPSTDGTLRVFRGGSNGSALKFLRSSNRNFAKPQTKHWSIGLRLVRVVSNENDIMAINGKCSRQPFTTALFTLDNPNAYDTSANDRISDVVAMTTTHAIVGASGEDDGNGNPNDNYPGASSGKAYIYDLSDGSLEYTLDNPNQYGSSSYDTFGNAVGISSSYAVVGAYRDEPNIYQRPGSAYLFNLSDGSLKHTLSNPMANNNNHTATEQKFGWSVDTSNTYAIVGAIRTQQTASSNSTYASGRGYVFNTHDGSLAYTLNNPNAYGTALGDAFGTSCAISDTYAIVGAPNEDDAGGTSSGKAYVYNISNSFGLAYILDNPNPDSSALDDRFGLKVAISDTHAIVSASQEDDARVGADSGKCYIYDLSDGSLLYTLTNPGTGNYFGYDVGISSTHAIVGSIYENSGGKAYIFDLSDGSLVSTVDNPNAYDTHTSDYFGHGVDIAGTKAIVGAPGEDDAGGTSSGKAYILDGE